MTLTASNSTESGTDCSPSPSEDMSSTCSSSISAQAPSVPNPRSGESHTCPYEDCRKSFSKKYNLKAHLRLHTGEQPFQCDRPDCRKKFKWRSSLSSHTVWHSRKDKASAKGEDDHQSAKKGSVPAKSDDHKGEVKSSGKKSNPKDTTQSKVKKTSTPPLSAVSKQGRQNPSTVSSKKKRPRTDGIETQTRMNTMSPGLGAKAKARGLSPSASQVVSSVSVVGDESVVKSAEKVNGASLARVGVKKRKLSKQSQVEPSEQVSNVGAVASTTDAVGDSCLPGSPVESDGFSQDTIELDLFPCDLLPPLSGGGGVSIALDGGNVDTMLIEDEAVDMFGEPLPPCGALNALDTRFGPFDLDNLQTFGLSKAEDF